MTLDIEDVGPALDAMAAAAYGDKWEAMNAGARAHAKQSFLDLTLPGLQVILQQANEQTAAAERRAAAAALDAAAVAAMRYSDTGRWLTARADAIRAGTPVPEGPPTSSGALLTPEQEAEHRSRRARLAASRPPLPPPNPLMAATVDGDPAVPLDGPRERCGDPYSGIGCPVWGCTHDGPDAQAAFQYADDDE